MKYPTVDAEIVDTMIAGIVRYEWRGGSVAPVYGGLICGGDFGDRDLLRLGGLDLRVIAVDYMTMTYYVMRAGFAAECAALAWRARYAVERGYWRALRGVVAALPGFEIPEGVYPALSAIRRRREGGNS